MDGIQTNVRSGCGPSRPINRLARGEPADVVIMVGFALDELIKQGKVDPASRVELADSRIGMVVKEGATKPMIDPDAALKNVLLKARSVAYSDRASGVYIEKELFKKLGIQEQLAPKGRVIERIPVASVVAKGDYEVGCQQVAELLPIPGRRSWARLRKTYSRSHAMQPASRKTRLTRRRPRRCWTTCLRPRRSQS